MVAGERFSGYSHLLGLVLAVPGTGLLLGQTLGGGDIARTAAAVVFSRSILALYAASTLFHSTRGRTKLFWQRADHCAIYLLIAGTCTPLALVTLQGAAGWVLFCVVWAAAIGGIVRELHSDEGARPSLMTYVGMGWLGLAAATPIALRIEARGLAWLLAGAVLYTVGKIFYRNRGGMRHAHGTWHLFVLAGTMSHYAAIAGFILSRPVYGRFEDGSRRSILGRAPRLERGNRPERGDEGCILHPRERLQSRSQHLALFRGRSRLRCPPLQLLEHGVLRFGNGEAVAHQLGLFRPSGRGSWCGLGRRGL